MNGSPSRVQTIYKCIIMCACETGQAGSLTLTVTLLLAIYCFRANAVPHTCELHLEGMMKGSNMYSFGVSSSKSHKIHDLFISIWIEAHTLHWLSWSARTPAFVNLQRSPGIMCINGSFVSAVVDTAKKKKRKVYFVFHRLVRFI